MSSHQRSASQAGGDREKTYFEQQREVLIGDIAMNFEHVLANINKLNRSLEAVIAVGNEFSSVEALWSQFENVMAKEPEPEPEPDQDREQAAETAEGEADDRRGEDEDRTEGRRQDDDGYRSGGSDDAGGEARR